MPEKIARKQVVLALLRVNVHALTGLFTWTGYKQSLLCGADQTYRATCNNLEVARQSFVKDMESSCVV